MRTVSFGCSSSAPTFALGISAYRIDFIVSLFQVPGRYIFVPHLLCHSLRHSLRHFGGFSDGRLWCDIALCRLPSTGLEGRKKLSPTRDSSNHAYPLFTHNVKG
jgi:hypothetical protein